MSRIADMESGCTAPTQQNSSACAIGATIVPASVEQLSSTVSSLLTRGGHICVLEADSMKRCSKCHEEKPLDQFNKDKTRSDGLFPQCRECKNADGARSLTGECLERQLAAVTTERNTLTELLDFKAKQHANELVKNEQFGELILKLERRAEVAERLEKNARDQNDVLMAMWGEGRAANPEAVTIAVQRLLEADLITRSRAAEILRLMEDWR
jgi:hypothetical protein